MTTPVEYELPASIPVVTVTGEYRGPDGRGLSGTVTFTGPGLLTFPDADIFIAGPVVCRLDEFGRFSATLPATDSPNMNPSDWSYTVKENLTGVAGSRTFAMLLPAGTGPVDLADVAPADPTTPTYVPVPGSQVYTGSAVPTSLLGRDGDFYTQYDVRTFLGVTSTTVTMWTRAAGSWATLGGALRGSAWYVNNAGTTASADTKPGDFLLRSDNGSVYQREAAGWGSAVMNLTGPKGAVGTQVLTGSAVPTSGVGVDSDLYAQSETTSVLGVDSTTVTYWKRAAGAWTKIVGAVRGAAIYVNNATGTPLVGTSPGDLLVRTDSGELFQRGASSWETKGNIKGPKGDTGATGATGDTGATGPAGADGTGSGTVSSVNAISPDGSGNVALTAANVGALSTADRGATNGVASLVSGKVPADQLPAAAPLTPKNMWTAQALGFEAWSCDPFGVANPVAKYLTPQRLYFTGFNITENTTVDRVVMFTRGYGGVSSNRYRAGIYRENGTKVVESAGVALTMAGQEAGSMPAMVANHSGAVPLAIAQTVLTPGRYWVAWSLVVGGASDFAFYHVQNEAPIATANFWMPGSAFARAWYTEGQTNAALPTTVSQTAAGALANHDIPILALANV